MKKFIIILIYLFPINAFSFDKITNFTFEKFENAQQSGKTIIVNSWNKNCSTCAFQSKILSIAQNDFNEVEFFFYEQTKNKKIAEFLNINFWSTIVVFKGKKEISREIGLVNKEDIYNIIRKGI